MESPGVLSFSHEQGRTAAPLPIKLLVDNIYGSQPLPAYLGFFVPDPSTVSISESCAKKLSSPIPPSS